jgi:hypothetical protein
MAKKALEIRSHFKGDDVARYIAFTWDTLNAQRASKIEQWKELRNYLFATDTTTTSNSTLPWKNKTTLPKLTQIRDNLHSNYISALFPNDDWLKWRGYSMDDSTKQMVAAIEAYMGNKIREGDFKDVVSQLVYDYIDYGNAFCTTEYNNATRRDDKDDMVIEYVGPRAKRISPMDIVFNPIAQSFRDSFKIIRSVKNIGELHMMAEDEPDNVYLKDLLTKRSALLKESRGGGLGEVNKADGFMMDGFGNYDEYLQSNYVEFLDFYGDIFDHKTNTLERGKVITIVDRMWVARKEDIPSWQGHAPIFHVGWRKRPDNLWAMGPLDNLVGMQYRIDHLENLKSDAMDLAVLPPLVIKGDVEAFTYGPGAEIHIDETGDVTELARNTQFVIQADNSIDRLEMRMEQYAGAPREAMGIRSAGEKTAFEVQQLQNAAGRIFQEKTNTFETELLEKVLNSMLETAKRNLDSTDIVRVIDDDLGIESFMTITKSDITASGKLRAVGARHFAAQAQLTQNLTGIFNTPIGQMITPHTSTKAMAKLIEELMGLQRFALFSPNVAVSEQKDTQSMMNQATEDLQVQQTVEPV